jgi:alpha-galactosidase
VANEISIGSLSAFRDGGRNADVCSSLPTLSSLEWNGLAGVPPMGWNSWYAFYGGVTEAKVRRQADLVISLGLKDLGYTYVNLDDGWQGGRDPNGNIIPDANKFPNGIAALADYVHSKGLKFGIYLSRCTENVDLGR